MYCIAIHGGAGTIQPNKMTTELEGFYKKGLSDAIRNGYNCLQAGGSALDAVEIAVRELENNPLFNAGKGAVFNNKGQHELDASIMCGNTLKAGAVCAVHHVRNPISLSRHIMEHSEHVLLCAEGAMEYANLHNIPLENDDYFFTQHRYDQWIMLKDTENVQLDHNVDTNSRKMGTVGAVALDSNGNLAAATSTGGMTNKKFGRVGDSPIIGAGTFAKNTTCAVSCTGHGELFIRSVVAYDISCLMEYKNCTLKEACDIVVYDKLVKIGGEGGLIAISKSGEIYMPFNSEGMYRASIDIEGNTSIQIYK